MGIERIPETDLEHLITPYFKHETVENVPQSELKGEPVMEIKEVVEVRFAGDKNYSPVLPVDAMYRKDGHKVVTYAERWAEQYAAFLSGSAQESAGTPLEKLAQYGISSAMLSLCRALKVYSIEALYNVDGANLKNLGMHANELKAMANAYMADRAKGSETAQELAALRAEVAALRAGAPLPVDEKAELALLPEGYENMTDEELKNAIADLAGARPRGNPSRDTLLRTLSDLKKAA